MPRIAELPPHLADLIAAGEVVERPASVIKELFENAVDAGADAVTVEISNGGLTMMRVSDNGCGIATEDAPRAFLRHATSKISRETDLEAISTLGFRGEALAAIAAVSRIELTSCDDSDEGVRIVLDGGQIVVNEPNARPRGTTITVRDLFYNTPARQKFMKSDRAEAAAIGAMVTRLALSRPDVAVRYIRDGEEELRTAGDSHTHSCIYSALGRDFSAGVLAFDYENEGVRAHGFVSRVETLRGNRNYQHFFVNGRGVKSRTLGAALEQAYRGRIFTGRFPACVIYIETGAGRLDVNVHPAKTEIKFLFEKHVFDAVHYGARTALDNDIAPPQAAPISHKSPPQPIATPAVEPLAAKNSMPYASPVTASSPAAPLRQSTIPAYAHTHTDMQNLEARNPVAAGYAAVFNMVYDSNSSAAAQPAANQSPTHIQTELSAVDNIADYRVVGEALTTYIIVETGGSVWLIDKHAAHERVHYDRLRGSNPDVMAQALLEPLIILPDGGDALTDNAELLAHLGFEVEPFGGGRLAVRQIPSDIEISDAEDALIEICAELNRGGDGDARRDAIFASIACKAAIKSGKSSGEIELTELAGRVMRGEIRHCPHGRPVAVELTRSFIDKSFKRV